MTVRAWQMIPTEMASLDLTEADGMRQAWFVDADNRLTGGAAAINAALAYVWWARPLRWLYQVPGLRQLEERLYRWVAANRNRMPGTTDACALPQSDSEEIARPNGR